MSTLKSIPAPTKAILVLTSLAMLATAPVLAAPIGRYDALHVTCANETARTTAEIVREGKKLGTPVQQSRLNSPAALYMEQVQTEACTHKKLKDQLQENPASVCGPKQAMLDCVYFQIRARTQVTAGLTMAQVLLVYAGLRDQEKVTDRSVVQIQLADKLLRVLEDAKPEVFYLAKLQANGPDAIAELTSLRAQDEVQFGSTINKTLESVEKNLGEIQLPNPSRTALEQWKTTSVTSLRTRLAKLKTKEWRYK